MNNSYNSDMIIKQKLEGYEMDFPMEIWDNIDVHRSFGYKIVNKLKRNWYLLPVLLVGFSFLLFWWMSPTPNQQGLERASLATMAFDNSNKSIITKEVESNANDFTEIGSKNDLHKSVKSDVKLNTNANKNDNSVADKKEHFNRNSFVKVSKNGGFNVVNDEGNVSEKAIFENKTPIEVKSVLKDSEEKISPKKEEKAIPANDIEPVLRDSEEKISPKKEEKAIPANLKELELAFLSPKRISTPIKRDLIENAISDIGCNNFGSKRHSNFMVDVLIGPDYSFKNLSLRSTEPTEYLGLREETESMVVGYSGQARFSLMTPSNIMLRSGLMFSQINERFKYEEVEVISTSEEPFMDTIIEGTTVTIIEGTVTVSDVERNQIESFNTYKSIDIPVLIGYHIDRNDLFFEINTGVMANIRFAKKGKLLNNDLAPQLIGESAGTFDQNIFKDNIGLSLYGSVAIGYQVNRDISFMIEPNVRYQFNPITEGTNQIIQKFLTTSLQFGARYHF